jgi:hypothetical protein
MIDRKARQLVKGFERKFIVLEAKRTDPHVRTRVRFLVDLRAGDDEASKVARAIAEHVQAPGVIIRRIVYPVPVRHAH